MRGLSDPERGVVDLYFYFYSYSFVCIEHGVLRMNGEFC